MRQAADSRGKQVVKVESTEDTCGGSGKTITDLFMLALTSREEANRSRKMTTIIFIRDKNSRGQEISWYTNYAQRLKTEYCEPYFTRKKDSYPDKQIWHLE